MEITVTVSHADGRRAADTLQITHVANLGMAGREPPPPAVRDDQIAAMNETGVSTPAELPFVVPKPNHLITTADSIQVNSPSTAGEAEFVLIPTDERTYVGVGNDHKDREVSATDMHIANSTCPSVISDEVWVLEEIVDHWEELELRSWVERDGMLADHQRARLEAFLSPAELIERVARSVSVPVEGMAIWSGTVGDDDGAVDPFPSVVPGPFYAVQLHDPVLDRRLFTRYDVRLNDWVEDVQLG